MNYVELLERLHEALQPRAYLEIGVEFGTTLALSRAATVAIDPAPKIRPEAIPGMPWIKLYEQESDAFFQSHGADAALEGLPLDLVFIDGYHEFSQVVRDLENVERWSHPGTVVVVHDVIPFNAAHASRQFRRGEWTGDVWRVVPFLREHRPDLNARLVDVAETGALVVTGFGAQPERESMGERAAALNAGYPPDGPGYERLVEEYVATTVAESPGSLLNSYRSLSRPIGHRVELRHSQTGPGFSADADAATVHDALARIALADTPRFGFRARLTLGAWGMDGFRLGFRSLFGPQLRERSVFVSVSRPGVLTHELERARFRADAETSVFDLDIEGALGAHERLHDIVIHPTHEDFGAAAGTSEMGIDVRQAEILQIPVVDGATRFLPEHLANAAPPAKCRNGKRDAVVFAWFVPEGMPELGEYYLNLLRYYHPDSRIFIGMNHGSHPEWESRVCTSGLDVEMRWARAEIGDSWDTTGFLTALEAFDNSTESFDLVWFAHTKGGSGANHTDYDRNRIELQQHFWSRRHEVDRIFEDPAIGVFARRFTPWWDGHAGDELLALQRIYRDAFAPLGLCAFDTFFVARDAIVRRFCGAVADGFFSTAPTAYGANRWFFEMAFPSVASMQGFEPFIDAAVPGDDDPRDDAWLRYDPKQNHRLVQRELERWRADPVGFEPIRIRQIWTRG